MTAFLLTVHLFVTLALIGVVLIQRSEGGGLGIGTSQGMGGFMSGRGTANLLTRTTAILGTIFFLLSLALALLNRGTTGVGRSLLDTPPASSVLAPVVPPAIVPGGPAVPGAALSPAAVPAGPALSGSTLPAAPVQQPSPAPVAPVAPSATELAPTGPAPAIELPVSPDTVIPDAPPPARQ